MEHHEHGDHGHHHHHADKNTLATPIAIIIAGLIIAGAIVMSNKGAAVQAPAAAQGAKAQVAVDISKVKTTGVPFIGNANAPVVVAFWSDYQCPFCKKFSNDSIAGLKKDFVATGKVKIVFKDFVFLGEDSKSAALVARGVWDVAPNKFGEWHDAVMNKQDGENKDWGDLDDVLALTKTILGDDLGSKVATNIVTKKTAYQAVIEADRAEGASMGVTGTPGTIIGKTYINGAQPYATVKAAVEKVLGK